MAVTQHDEHLLTNNVEIRLGGHMRHGHCCQHQTQSQYFM